MSTCSTLHSDPGWQKSSWVMCGREMEVCMAEHAAEWDPEGRKAEIVGPSERLAKPFKVVR
jgi:hypothetical protein